MRTIGLDHGNGYCKAHDGATTVVFPSVAGPAVSITFRSRLQEPRAGDLLIHTRGRGWFVGELALRQSPSPVAVRGQERDPEMLRVLMLGALYRLAVPNEERLRVITGLPVDWYHPAVIGPTKAALLGQHDCAINGEVRRWTVEACECYPQPFGTVAYEVLRAGGDGTIAGHAVGVIDVGFGTTNLARFDELEYVQVASASIEAGIGLACELVAREVAERYRVELGRAAAERALGTGIVEVAGRLHPIPEVRDRALATVEEAIAAAVGRLWGNARQLYAIKVTGGGGHVLGDRLARRYPQASTVPQPQVANAIGFWLYGRL